MNEASTSYARGGPGRRARISGHGSLLGAHRHHEGERRREVAGALSIRAGRVVVNLESDDERTG
jgi:hypothetical protein